MNPTTLILGASTNPERYAYLAAKKLLAHGHPIILVGVKSGDVEGNEILHSFPKDVAVDTITLYLGPRHQAQYYDDIIRCKPRRVIFNPGTENDFLVDLCRENDIEAMTACTLVLLSIGQY